MHFYFPPKKTHNVWFKSILNYGDTENVLINHLLLVIPMLYPCHYTNLCPHKPHKHAHTHTHASGLLSLWGLSIGVMLFLLYRLDRKFYCPTLTLHLNLALTGNFLHFYIFKKLHFVWFITSIYVPTVTWVPMILCVFRFKSPPYTHTHTHTHSKISAFVFCRRRKILEVCNNTMVSKWWQNIHLFGL